MRLSKMLWYLYLVKCRDGSFYTRITIDSARRIWQHNNNKLGAQSLKGKLPVKLVYQEIFNNKSDATRREQEIKGWRREKKLKLIEGFTLSK